LDKEQEFKGNTTDKLWDMMGNVVNAQGVERHGQSCFLYVYPNGSDEARKGADSWVDSDILIEDETPSGPIDLVAESVLADFVRMDGWKGEPEYEGEENDPSLGLFEYDGYRVGAGWIYAAILAAKAHGCTQANVYMSSNDGNIGVECWDKKIAAYVTAVHITYYGT
jgi:hypothetical protein